MVFGIEHLPLFVREQVQVAILLAHALLLLATGTAHFASPASLTPCLSAILVWVIDLLGRLAVLRYCEAWLRSALKILDVLIKL